MKWLWLWVCVVVAPGCTEVDEATCAKACKRPFAISRTTGDQRAKAWSRMPEPLKSGAIRVVDRWRIQLAAAEQEYVEACIPQCQSQASEHVVRCRERAGNKGEWLRCGQP